MDSAKDLQGGSDGGVLGVDVGGTKILAIRVVGNQLVDRERVPSHDAESSVVQQIERAVEALMGRSPATPERIGLGIAGFVGMDGIAHTAPNTPGLVGVDLIRLLGDRYGVPIRVNNDANCAAIAAAEGRPTKGGLIAITVGTGIGGGFIVDGKLIRGRNGFAAEPGHMVIDPDGPECPCGNRGCWEAFASGSGLAWIGRQAAGEGRADALVTGAGSIDGITGELITRLVESGNPEAVAVFERFTFYLSLGIANLIMLLDPAEIVIGGGLAELRDQLIDPLKRCLAENFPSAVSGRKTEITIADLGEEAGAWGAALLARED